MDEITFTGTPFEPEPPEPGERYEDIPEVSDKEYIAEIADAQWRRIQRVERRVNHLKDEVSKDTVFHAFLIGLILGIVLTARNNRKDDK